MIRTCSFYVQQYLRLFCIRVEYNPRKRGQEMMLVVLNRHVSSHRIDVLLLYSQLYVVHVHRQEQSFLSIHKQAFPNWVPFTIRDLIECSRIAFPIIVLQVDDHTDFVQEERLGLPYWTKIWATCVVVDESKCLDTPILDFSIEQVHPPS